MMMLGITSARFRIEAKVVEIGVNLIFRDIAVVASESNCSRMEDFEVIK